MSLLSRLFGATPPPPAPNTVVIDPELASQLTAEGEPLDRAVHVALRAHLTTLSASPSADAQSAAAPGQPAARNDNDRVPFWLQRDADKDSALEDQLRNRIINRREAETDRQA